MPSTMTRLNRVRSSAGSLRLVGRNGRSVGPLLGKHVALVGAQASPYVTGFAGFTSSLHDLLAERADQVSRPLQSTGSDSAVSGAPDLVVAVLPGPGAAAAAVELADRHDVPLLVVVQGETVPLTHGPGHAGTGDSSGTAGARLAARLESRALRRADRWAVTGQQARDRLLRSGVDDALIEDLPYWAPASCTGPADGDRPVDGHRPVDDDERAAVRRSFGWPDGVLVVCPAGADTAALTGVVEAAQVLASRHSQAHLVVVGRGPRLRALSASTLSAPNLTVAQLNDDEYGPALAAADLVLVIEAADRPDGASVGRLVTGLSAGRPVIGAVAGDGHLSVDLARAEAAVVTVSPDRPEQLANAIDVLADAPQARAVMASAAEHYARVMLDPGTAAATFEGIVARTLSRTAGSSWWGRNR
jgi:colanic acid biosynthesis glycosyl transferase WcaI